MESLAQQILKYGLHSMASHQGSRFALKNDSQFAQKRVSQPSLKQYKPLLFCASIGVLHMLQRSSLLPELIMMSPVDGPMALSPI